MDDMKREMKLKIEAETKKDVELKEAGERIRKEALNRILPKHSRSQESDPLEASEDESILKKRRKYRLSAAGLGGWEVLLQIEESRKDFEEKRLEFEKQRLEESKKEKELEREERMERLRLEKEEKRAMISLLQTLTKRME